MRCGPGRLQRLRK